MTNAQSTSHPLAGADLWRVKFDCFWGVTWGWKGKKGCESSPAMAFILASETHSGLPPSCPSSPSLSPLVLFFFLAAAAAAAHLTHICNNAFCPQLSAVRPLESLEVLGARSESFEYTQIHSRVFRSAACQK